ncbi:hypothetical protein [Rhizobium leguminosarum]
MRSFYSIRSIGSCAVILASLIGLFLVTAPASAEIVPLDAGYHLAHDQNLPDFAYVIYDILPAAEVSRIERTAVDPLIAFSETHPLKPEYAESYASAGQNFIDLRRRC